MSDSAVAATGNPVEIDAQQHEQQQQSDDVWPEVVDLEIHLPSGQTVVLPSVNVTENLTSVRQALAEFQETAFLTCFSWKLRAVLDADGAELLSSSSLEVVEFAELNSLVADVQARTLVLEVVPGHYDVKQARLHVKRLHDTLSRPFLLSAARQVDESVPTASASAAVSGSVAAAAALPSLDQLPAADLSLFFDRVFQSDTTATARAAPVSALSGAIKSVALSGYSPVPAQRRLQGDLLYVEVSLASEGSVCITATARGFFVNKSNRTHFDPSPAGHGHYFHSLFDTLAALSPAVRAAWQTLCAQSRAWALQTVPGAMDAVAGLVASFAVSAGDSAAVAALPANSWLAPTTVTVSVAADQLSSSSTSTTMAQTLSGAAHKYDMLRAQDSLGDLAGVEELGAPREWNDELQSIRALQATDLNAQILKARLEHRMVTEFTDFCRRAVVAIAEGLVAPLTYSDPAQSDIFVYNGVFFSRAEDSKDNLHFAANAEV
jgi:protein TIF31